MRNLDKFKTAQKKKKKKKKKKKAKGNRKWFLHYMLQIVCTAKKSNETVLPEPVTIISLTNRIRKRWATFFDHVMTERN